MELDDYEENSDIDDDDLMKRLEIKYGKIEVNETAPAGPPEDEDESWTSNLRIINDVFSKYVTSFMIHPYTIFIML